MSDPYDPKWWQIGLALLIMCAVMSPMVWFVVWAFFHILVPFWGGK